MQSCWKKMSFSFQISTREVKKLHQLWNRRKKMNRATTATMCWLMSVCCTEEWDTSSRTLFSPQVASRGAHTRAFCMSNTCPFALMWGFVLVKFPTSMSRGEYYSCGILECEPLFRERSSRIAIFARGSDRGMDCDHQWGIGPLLSTVCRRKEEG